MSTDKKSDEAKTESGQKPVTDRSKNAPDEPDSDAKPATLSNFYTCAGYWIKINWFWVIAYGFALMFFACRAYSTDPLINQENYFLRFVFPAVVLLCVVFVNIYTNPIELQPAEEITQEQRKIEENNSWQRRNMMVFAYCFMLISMLLTIYPFTTRWFTQGLATSSYSSSLRERPIAVFIGCTLDGDKEKDKNLQCPQPADEEKSQAPQEGKPKTGQKGKSESAVQEFPKEQSQGGYSWILNIGGYIKGCSPETSSNGNVTTCKVSGGLLIPLYFIIIALMGGSISLTRRLPEYQKRANPDHVQTEKEPKLTQHAFRENLIFQIVQFISAPLIAVLAYYLVNPNNTMNSVALAFAAGFSSESVLLMIRSVADKITPDSSKDRIIPPKPKANEPAK
jgi:hypothetical protein